MRVIVQPQNDFVPRNSPRKRLPDGHAYSQNEKYSRDTESTSATIPARNTARRGHPKYGTYAIKSIAIIKPILCPNDDIINDTSQQTESDSGAESRASDHSVNDTLLRHEDTENGGQITAKDRKLVQSLAEALRRQCSMEEDVEMVDDELSRAIDDYSTHYK